MVFFNRMKVQEKWVTSFLHPANQDSPLNLRGVLILLICCAGLMIADFLNAGDGNKGWLTAEAVVILLLLLIQCVILWWDNTIKLNEVIQKAKGVMRIVDECSKKKEWGLFDFVSLHLPLSPCVSLQWTLRAGKLVNMPTVLLVEGDVILLRPGQPVPALCQSLAYDQPPLLLRPGECFSPERNFTMSASCQSRQPIQPQPFIIKETPFSENLRLMLQTSEHPTDCLNSERHLIQSFFVEKILLPLFLMLFVLVNTCRYVLLDGEVGMWPEILIVLPIQGLLPLCSVIFPLVWRFLCILGLAKVLSIYTCSTEYNLKRKESDADDINSLEKGQGSMTWKWSELLSQFNSLLIGRSSHLPRTANLLSTLGNLTSLCVIDKKGILSWPSPTVEKVFFLLNDSKLNKPSNDNEAEFDLDDSSDSGSNTPEFCGPLQEKYFEVLNLTQVFKDSLSLVFDDPNWQSYLNSLKPLGLNILLNSCNMSTLEEYSRFSDHVTCESMKRERAVPVLNRRCFCQLSEQIGFSETASTIFNTIRTQGAYRHFPKEPVTGHSTKKNKYKMPMQHIFSVMSQEKSSGTIQLMSQGTGDMLLDFCSEYWNGTSLCPMTTSERKQVADFYHRTSMSSYCTAFSYRPINHPVNESIDAEMFLEFPEGFCNPSADLSNCNLNSSGAVCYHGSVDSLLAEGKMVTDEESLGDQIFVGMVSMQYQAKPDIVALVEDLEVACIRFVHFSKENELRSRVFSEKMGLEAGWNCHISLLSEATNEADELHHAHKLKMKGTGVSETPAGCRRSSAPSAINTESIQVKFELSSQESFASPAPMTPAVEIIDSLSPLLKKSSTVPAQELSSSESYPASSYITDNTDSMSGGLSNRAKLPKGIENIRPHIDNVDNVPLLVSLFTDCIPETTREMLCILQENKEVVCCLGSSLNMENTHIFLQADSSISLDPILPYVCQKHISRDDSNNTHVGPMALSSQLLSIPCSLNFKCDETVRLCSLICEARAHCFTLRTGCLLLLSSSIALALLHFLAAVLLLPPPIATHHNIWLITVCLPLLAISCIGVTSDKSLMSVPVGKKADHFSAKVIAEFIGMSWMRFFPSLLVCLACHFLILHNICSHISQPQLCSAGIGFVKGLNQSNTWRGWYSELGAGLNLSQNVVCFEFVFFTCITSSSLVHRGHYFWQRSPFRNKLWTIIVVVLLTLQVAYFCLSVLMNLNYDQHNFVSILQALPLSVVIVIIAWSIILLPVLELLKKRDIKQSIRFQKRARLDFGTKLGMNSPF